MLRRGVPHRKLQVVSNGTLGSPRTRKLEEYLPLKPKRPALVTVAGMFQRKGIAELIDAFEQIALDFLETHLYLVGDGADRSLFEAQARKTLVFTLKAFSLSLNATCWLLISLYSLRIANPLALFSQKLVKQAVPSLPAIAINAGTILKNRNMIFMANNTKIKVLLYGNAFHTDCRFQALVKFLTDSEYYIYTLHPNDYMKTIGWKNLFLQKVFTSLHLFELLVKAAFVDVIYLLPMNVRFIENAILAAKVYNKKLVVEMYFSLYDTFVRDRKIIKEESRKSKKLMNQDILALTRSNYIIHTSNYELTYWEKLMDIEIDKSKVSIAPICNVSTLVLRREFMQDGVLRICWWGSFIPLHGLDNILQAMKNLQTKGVNFTCHLFGLNNDSFPVYLEKIKLNRLESHVFLRKDMSFFQGSLPEYLVDNCDLALGIFGNTDKAHNAIPNKLIEALSMEIPTLTMNSPALREFFNPETDLWVCEPSPESITESILTIADGAARSVNWKKTRQKVLDTFSIFQYQEVVGKVLAAVKDELLEEKTLDVKTEVTASYQSANQVKH